MSSIQPVDRTTESIHAIDKEISPMPPNIFGIGVSPDTARKQHDYGGYVSIIANAAYGAMQKRKINQPFYLYDLYAARPFYPGVDGEEIEGSAVIGHRILSELDKPFHMICCEKELDNAAALTDYFRGDGRVSVQWGDNAVTLPPLLTHTRSWRYGLVYVDPNNVDLPTDLLVDMFRREAYGPTDLLVNIATTTLKRVINADHTKLSESLTDFMGRINKKYWLIREPSGRAQWTILIGSNWVNFPDWKKQGFHRVDTERGANLLLQCDKTKQQVMDELQPSFFE